MTKLEGANVGGTFVTMTGPLVTDFLFDAGHVSITPGALAAFERNNDFPDWYLCRHQQGDFGQLDAHDREMNMLALKEDGSRLLSRYTLPRGDAIYIITYPGRETTLCLVSEY